MTLADILRAGKANIERLGWAQGDDWFVLHPDIEAAARLPAPPSPAKTGGAE